MSKFSKRLDEAVAAQNRPEFFYGGPHWDEANKCFVTYTKFASYFSTSPLELERNDDAQLKELVKIRTLNCLSYLKYLIEEQIKEIEGAGNDHL
jgi:hypothetical protein